MRKPQTTPAAGFAPGKSLASRVAKAVYNSKSFQTPARPAKKQAGLMAAAERDQDEWFGNEGDQEAYDVRQDDDEY